MDLELLSKLGKKATMRLTKRQAIRECKKLWKEIKKSGLSKNQFLCSEEGAKWRNKGYWASCPLCEYAIRADGRGRCDRCPLVLQYGRKCDELGYSLFGDLVPPEFFTYIKDLKE